MTENWGKTPTSDAELYDKLAALFGYGTWDELAADGVPFWKYRMKEIAKVGASRKKNDCSVIEASRMADYCKAKGISISGPHQIYRHRADARRWWAAKEKAEFDARLDGLINDAVAIEAQIPDSPWLHRLIHATGPDRAEVYRSWEHLRSSLSVNPTASSAPAPS